MKPYTIDMDVGKDPKTSYKKRKNVSNKCVPQKGM